MSYTLSGSRRRRLRARSVVRAVPLESLGNLPDAYIDRIMGIDGGSLAGLGDVDLGDLGSFKSFLAKVKKAVTPPARIMAQLKKSGGLLKAVGSIVRVAATAIATIYPPAGVIIGPVLKMVDAGMDKLKIIEEAKKRAATVLDASKKAQAALVSVVKKTEEAVLTAAQEGKPVPKEIIIEGTAVEKEKAGIPLTTVPVPAPAPAPPPATEEKTPAMRRLEERIEARREAQAERMEEAEKPAPVRTVRSPTAAEQVHATPSEGDLTMAVHEKV